MSFPVESLGEEKKVYSSEYFFIDNIVKVKRVKSGCIGVDGTDDGVERVLY